MRVQLPDQLEAALNRLMGKLKHGEPSGERATVLLLAGLSGRIPELTHLFPASANRERLEVLGLVYLWADKLAGELVASRTR